MSFPHLACKSGLPLLLLPSCMAEKLKYHAFKRNTLLEELQTILHEYPDNEQIIKELLQNAEDAGAHVVKMGLCTSSRSEHLPDPYKKYLSSLRFFLQGSMLDPTPF
uniref:Sacsin/Nov domain-containing protein n=1 Tax=Magallana gigas TaxID=29159 RepID=K1PM18_MAGGI